jgi:hypothetical protein
MYPAAKHTQSLIYWNKHWQELGRRKTWQKFGMFTALAGRPSGRDHRS